MLSQYSKFTVPQVSLLQNSKRPSGPKEPPERAINQPPQQQNKVLLYLLRALQLVLALRYPGLETFSLRYLGLEETYFEAQQLVLHPQGVYVGRRVKIFVRQLLYLF
jgi:hypothetical protein